MFNAKEHYYLRSVSSDYQHAESTVSKLIKTIKMNLMSRNIERQIQAINSILNIIHSKTSTVTSQILIGADIPGLLCDVMNNHNPKLIIKVFFCLLELSKDEEFYRQKHSTVVTETTCRTIRILASEGNNGSTIHKGIVLLIQCLSGRCESEATINLHQVVGIVSDVLKSHVFQGLHLAAMSLLKTILQAKDFDHKDLPDLIYLSLTLIFKLKKNNAKIFNKHIKLALQIMTYSLKYFSTHLDTPLAQKSCNAVWSLINLFVIPSIKELDVNKCGPNIVVKKLGCILTVYDCLSEKKLKYLSNHLAAEGYLTILPDLDQHFKNKAVHRCVINIIFHILARLANSVLKIPMRDCQLVGKGLTKLPADATIWSDLLAETQPGYVHKTIIIHLYFVLLCDCQCLTNPSMQLLALSKYLLSQRSPPSSIMLKAISFVFAVLSLSYPLSVEGLPRELLLATRKVVQWLKCTVLSKVFTHHPAMLYWFFSAQVNEKILQMHSVMLWMTDKGPASCKELKELVLKKNEAALCVLDVLNCCSESLVWEAMSLLKAVLARDMSKKRLDTSTYIWCNLSSTLSCLSTPGWEKRLLNVCCVIFLACKGVPHRPNVTLMLRLTQQLVQTFQKTCGKTWEETLNNTRNRNTQLLLTQLFKLTHIIICKMNLANDYRGLKIFLEEDSLRRGLLASLDSDNKIITHPALKLLTYLQYSQKLHNVQIKNRGTMMGAEFLLQLMSTGRADTALLTANFFSNLRVLDPKVFITLSNDMSIITIYTLYLEFLNLSVRLKKGHSLSWRCESMLLQYCHHHNREMEEQLLNFPLNTLALRVAFTKEAGIGDKHLAEYLYMYVKGVRSHKLVRHCSYARAICRDPVSTILTITAEQLLTKDWPTDSLHSHLICQICTIGGNIPLGTIRALKLKMPRRYIKVGRQK